MVTTVSSILEECLDCIDAYRLRSIAEAVIKHLGYDSINDQDLLLDAISQLSKSEIN